MSSTSRAPTGGGERGRGRGGDGYEPRMKKPRCNDLPIHPAEPNTCTAQASTPDTRLGPYMSSTSRAPTGGGERGSGRSRDGEVPGIK
jgi:hypothetical protein